MAKIDNTKEPLKPFNGLNPFDSLFIKDELEGSLGAWWTKPLKIKRLHPDAVIPSYSKEGDAGLDLTCVDAYIKDGLWCCEIGLAFEIPKGYFGAIYPRSSIKDYDLRLSNCVGVVDSQFRGGVKAFFDITAEPSRLYQKGDRCCQMIIQKYEQVFPIEVSELSQTERGHGGFGHTGK